jgi:hypothetical protein
MPGGAGPIGPGLLGASEVGKPVAVSLGIVTFVTVSVSVWVLVKVQVTVSSS